MSKAKTEARRKRRLRKRERSKFGQKLNKFRPKSELWFLEQIKKHDLRFPFEENITFGGYIPDFINKHYKVIVEVDGSIHNLDKIKKKDIKKTKKYNQLGYEVIRVIAYDDISLKNAINRLKEIRLSKPLN